MGWDYLGTPSQTILCQHHVNFWYVVWLSSGDFTVHNYGACGYTSSTCAGVTFWTVYTMVSAHSLTIQARVYIITTNWH